MGSCGSKKPQSVAPDRRVSTLYADKAVLSFSELEMYFSAAHSFLSPKLVPLFQEVLAKKGEERQLISLNFAVIGENQATHLAKVIVFYPHLKTLKLWKTRLGAAGMKRLGSSLGHMVNLEYLGLEDNALNDEGAAALSEGLMPLCKLSELYLQINAIGDFGIDHLSKSLLGKPTLGVLNLSENSIQSLSLTLLLSAVSPSIRVLDLAHNRLGSEGAEVLLGAWTSLTKLEKLSIGGNGLGDAAERELVSMSSRVQVLI